MEAASVPAAPAAADANGQVQPPAAPAQAAPPTPDPAAPASPESDVLSQMDAMRQEIEALKGGQAPAAPESDPDLLTALQGDPSEGFTPEELAALQAGQAPGQADPQQQEAQLAELDAYMKEQLAPLIDEAVAPLIQERQLDAVRSFQKEHPDVVEYIPQIEATMQNAVERYGDEAKFDPNLIKLAYIAAKGEKSDAAAIPAEQAGADGASLETGAGQAQVGEDSEADEYRKALKSTATSNPFG